MDFDRIQTLSRLAAVGRASEEELEELLALLDDDFAGEASMSRAWGEATGVLSPDLADAIWRNIEAESASVVASCETDVNLDSDKISTDTLFISEPQRRRRLWLRRAIAAAAVMLLLVSAGAVGWWFAVSESRPAGEYLMTVERGQKARLTLPDGTKVWLNSGTTLAYNAGYGGSNRRLTLDGEAYFDVAKNTRLPFMVEAGGVVVRALGTKFNVKAYRADSLVTATLAEGRLQVSDARHSVTLNPMDVATYAVGSARLELSSTDNLMLAEYWRTDRLVFDGETLGNICRTIERMYGVDISITDRRLEDIRFTGTIRNNSLNNVFLLLSLSYPLDCNIDGERVTITPKTIN